MKDLVKFILFLAYTLAIFFVTNYFILAFILVFNMTFMIFNKIDIKKATTNLIKLLPFILFTAFINFLFVDLKFAILIAVRLILVCNISYSYSRTVTYIEFGGIIQKLMYPFKIFGINPEEIGLIVIIALTFMPIMRNELGQMKNLLKIKGIKPTNINILKNLNLIFRPFFISVLQRLNEIEMALKIKGWQE